MKHRIASIVSGQVAVGSRVVGEGWVRTRRDSKAGVSFIAVHDGSCFDPLQIVAPAGEDAGAEERVAAARLHAKRERPRRDSNSLPAV